MAIVPRQVLRMACVGVVPALMLGGCFGDDDAGSAGSSGTGGSSGTSGSGGFGGIIALAMAGFGGDGAGGFGGIIALAMAGFGGDGGDDAGTSDDAGSD